MQHTHNDAFGPQVPAKQIGCTDGDDRRRLGTECVTLGEWEGKGDATGMEVVAHPQERAMPKPHPTPSASHVGAPSERVPIACLQQASHGSKHGDGC